MKKLSILLISFLLSSCMIQYRGSFHASVVLGTKNVEREKEKQRLDSIRFYQHYPDENWEKVDSLQKVLTK